MGRARLYGAETALNVTERHRKPRSSSPDSTSPAPAARRGRFERKHEPLLPFAEFRRRVLAAAGGGFALVAVALALGAVGYHATEGMRWLDATLNAAMILTGMGQVTELHTDAGKLFAIGYALFSGVVFLTVMALVLAPVAHRILHAFHLEIDAGD